MTVKGLRDAAPEEVMMIREMALRGRRAMAEFATRVPGGEGVGMTLLFNGSLLAAAECVNIAEEVIERKLSKAARDALDGFVRSTRKTIQGVSAVKKQEYGVDGPPRTTDGAEASLPMIALPDNAVAISCGHCGGESYRPYFGVGEGQGGRLIGIACQGCGGGITRDMLLSAPPALGGPGGEVVEVAADDVDGAAYQAMGEDVCIAVRRALEPFLTDVPEAEPWRLQAAVAGTVSTALEILIAVAPDGDAALADMHRIVDSFADDVPAIRAAMDAADPDAAQAGDVA